MNLSQSGRKQFFGLPIARRAGLDRLMKVREVLRILRDDGWVLARTRGSHRIFKHPVKANHVTVPGKESKDLAIGTLKSIFRQAELDEPNG